MNRPLALAIGTQIVTITVFGRMAAPPRFRAFGIEPVPVSPRWASIAFAGGKK